MFNCTNCDTQYDKWEGRCRECGQWGTIVESETFSKNSSHLKINMLRTQSVAEASHQIKKSRILLGWHILDEVLGGGLTVGSVTLIAGEPGIGKSTLALQIARNFQGSILYVSGEENEAQVADRAVRLGLGAGKGLHLVSAQSVHDVIRLAETMEPEIIIVDSIQTVISEDADGSAGSVGQVKATASQLVTLAKRTEIPIIIIGHVTKEGTIAGPKTLEHLVDTVCQFESDTSGAYRLLKILKHRFGPTDNVAVWELRADGLHTIDATETVFLPPAPEKSSRVIGTITEGTRAFLVEIQALITPTSLPYPDRTVTGFDSARLKMLIAVLQRYGGISLHHDDVFVNVVGGWQGDDTALDAAVITALSLAKKGNLVEQSTYILIGEVGLDGFIRPGKGIVPRLKAAHKISHATIIAPLNPDREMFPSVKVAPSCAELIKLIS